MLSWDRAWSFKHGYSLIEYPPLILFSLNRNAIRRFSSSHNSISPFYQVAIIVPYRNRTEQLRIFLRFMHPFLQRQELLYRIFVVEQVHENFLFSFSHDLQIKLAVHFK